MVILLWVLKIILFLGWLYFLSVFHRGNLPFFTFLTGSIGSFFLMVNFIPCIKPYFIYLFTRVFQYVGDVTQLFTCYPKYGMIFIDYKDTVISMYIDMECSGLIEMMVFFALLLFFPVYRKTEKIRLMILGIFLLNLFNYIRIFTIICLIHVKGMQIYGFAHSIIGRLLFYALVIALYFYVFTKKQLENQRVGKFSFENQPD